MANPVQTTHQILTENSQEFQMNFKFDIYAHKNPLHINIMFEMCSLIPYGETFLSVLQNKASVLICLSIEFNIFSMEFLILVCLCLYVVRRKETQRRRW